MTVKITTTWSNPNQDTVWNRLAARLGRQPTNAEAAAEVRRILQESNQSAIKYRLTRSGAAQLDAIAEEKE